MHIFVLNIKINFQNITYVLQCTEKSKVCKPKNATFSTSLCKKIASCYEQNRFPAMLQTLKNQHVFNSIQLKTVNQSKFSNGTLLHILQNMVTDEERTTSAAKLI